MSIIQVNVARLQACKRVEVCAGVCGFTVAEWLKHSPATLEMTGSRPTFWRYFRDLFSRIDTVSGTEGLEMVCVALRELTVPCNVSGDNW